MEHSHIPTFVRNNTTHCHSGESRHQRDTQTPESPRNISLSFQPSLTHEFPPHTHASNLQHQPHPQTQTETLARDFPMLPSFIGRPPTLYPSPLHPQELKLPYPAASNAAPRPVGGDRRPDSDSDSWRQTLSICEPYPGPWRLTGPSAAVGLLRSALSDPISIDNGRTLYTSPATVSSRHFMLYGPEEVAMQKAILRAADASNARLVRIAAEKLPRGREADHAIWNGFFEAQRIPGRAVVMITGAERLYCKGCDLALSSARHMLAGEIHRMRDAIVVVALGRSGSDMNMVLLDKFWPVRVLVSRVDNADNAIMTLA